MRLATSSARRASFRTSGHRHLTGHVRTFLQGGQEMTGIDLTGKMEHYTNRGIDAARQASKQLADGFHTSGGCTRHDEKSILLKQ